MRRDESCRGRRVYRTKEAAEAAAERENKVRGFPHFPFKCKECGWYHLRGIESRSRRR